MLSSILKEKIRNRQKPIGMLMTFDFWPGYLEIMKKNRMDFVIVDLEHGSPGSERLEELCRLGRALDFPVIVRPAWCDYIQIKKAIDIGAGGIMVPWVETEEQLDTLERSVFSPPRGIHGMGGPSIMAADGVRAEDWDALEAGLLVTCQIETPKGVAMADRIASRDFLDIVMTGPYDLAHNMGLLDAYLSAPHLDALLKIKDTCHNAGKPVGMVVGDGKQAKMFFDYGFDLVVIGEVSGMFRRGLKECLDEFRAPE